MIETENYKNLTTKAFEANILGGNKPSVLIFGTDWSGNAAIMHSMMERISKEFINLVNFYEVDIEKQINIPKFYGVTKVPTMIIIKDNVVIDFVDGYISANKVRSKINTIIQEK